MTRHVTGRANRMLALALWHRDGGLCGRCRLPIERGIAALLPGGLTIGHIVPVSRGGSNDPTNLRAEHRRCNLEAGNRAERPAAVIVAPR